MTTAIHLFRALLVLMLLQVAGFAQTPQNFTVKVTIIGKGTVALATYIGNAPGPSKDFTESGKITLEEGALVYLNFHAADGYRVDTVTDNGENPLVTRAVVTGSTGPSYNFQLTENHDIVVKYIIDNPVGTFPLAFKDGTTAIPIVDISGHYTGVVPKNKKPYQLDVAMDDSGKVDGMGSVDGFQNKNGENVIEGSGKVKTKNGKPMASGNAGTAGTLDNVPVSGSGSASGPVEITDGANGPEVDGIVASGSGKQNGTRFTQPKDMFNAPAQPANLDKNFSVELTLTEMTSAKGKKYIVASAILNMPNGDRTKFNEKRSLYSLTRGYVINFANGVKVDGNGNPILNLKGKPTIDHKSTLGFSKIMLEKSGNVWNPTAGILKYRFLGQSGQGNIVDFITNV